MEILKGLPVANSINEQLIEDIKNIDGGTSTSCNNKSW